ncbi:MAG: TolC family protein, partial [Phycisphaerales bacterium]|nr:TolC family protein [Phycisphaerales bacterium]
MESNRNPCRRLRATVASGLVLVCWTGCRSYDARPLDLEAHRLAVASRLDEVASMLDDRTQGADGIDFDLSDGLNVREAEVVALVFNRDLRLARADAGVTSARSASAGTWEDPVFGFDGAEILSGAGPFEYGLTLGLTIPVSGRLAIERERAGAEHEVALRRVIDAEWRTRASVRAAWATWEAANATASIHRAVIERVARLAEVTSSLESSGELARVEGRLVRIELAERRRALAMAEL